MHSQWWPLPWPYIGTRSVESSSAIPIYELSLKMIEKWNVPYTVPEYTWVSLTSVFIRAKSNNKCTIVAIIGSVTSHFPVSIVFKSAYPAMWVMNCLLDYNPFPTDEMFIASQYSHCFHGRCSSYLHPLVPPVQIFTSMNRHNTYTEWNHNHSLLHWWGERQPLLLLHFGKDSRSLQS